MMLSCLRPVIGTVAQEDSNDRASVANDMAKKTRLRLSGKLQFNIDSTRETKPIPRLIE
jgi:hypothetical protein